MIDITTYRCRIGNFSQLVKNKKSKFINKFDMMYQDKSGTQTFKFIKSILKVLLLVTFLSSGSFSSVTARQCVLPGKFGGLLQRHGGVALWEDQHVQRSQLFIGVGQKSEVNFQARYVNGNRGQKGIKNLHLNIRSDFHLICIIL